MPSADIMKKLPASRPSVILQRPDITLKMKKLIIDEIK